MRDLAVQDSPVHGKGVFALRRFRARERILMLDDSRVVDGDHPLRPDEGERPQHCDYLARGTIVLMGEPERYINSSCDPNAFVRSRSHGRREAIALQDIGPGEEVLFDYIINCDGGIVWECACGSPRCRGTVPGSFFDLPVDEQLRYLPLLDSWFEAEHRDFVRALRRREDAHAG